MFFTIHKKFIEAIRYASVSDGFFCAENFKKVMMKGGGEEARYKEEAARVMRRGIGLWLAS